MNACCVMLADGSIIVYANENPSPTGVGKRDNLTGQGGLIRHISFELMAAVLPASDDFKEFYCFQIS